MILATRTSRSTRETIRQRRVVAALAFVLALCIWPSSASADTINVSTTEQLQAAVANGNAGDTIALAGGDYFPTVPLEIKRDLTISGPTASPGAHLDGSAIEKSSSLGETLDMFVVHPGVTATIRYLDVTTVSTDAAAYNVFGSLTLEDSLISLNNGTGVLAQTGSKVSIQDTTINDNKDGLAVDFGSAATLLNVTIFHNRSGISNGNGGQVDMTNTIVAGSASLGGSDCVLPIGSPGAPGSSTNSLDQDSSCAANIHDDPRIGKLANNGGPMPTRGLIAGSPAIDAGSGCPTLDQRGAPRIGACDIGAFEFGSTAPASKAPLPAPSPSTPSTASGSQPSAPASSPGSQGTAGSQTGAATKHAAVALHLRGRGSLVVRGGRATFQLSATAGKLAGLVTFRDAHAGIDLRATKLTSVAVDAKRGTATLRGVWARPKHSRRIGFTVVVAAGRHSSLHIKLSNGYERTGSIHSGSVSIA